MNKWEKQVQRSLLRDEQRILRILELMYRDVLRETEDRIAAYFARLVADPTDAAAVYQLRYQQVLADQIGAILDGFEDKNYTAIQDYLEDCYTNGYVGAMYDIHKQGIPVVTPIRQENVVRAITTDSKISVPMYTRLGNNIAQLKTAIAAEVTRGIASGQSWHDTAAGISRQGQVSAYNAMRIARTEGHRISCEAQMDGCRDAKSAGADVVKQWSAAHDERTREHHRQLDGQLRELDEPFEVAGIRVQYPGSFGRPEEDIHCRCALLQRARWALSEEELEQLRGTEAAQALAEIEDFEKFKGKYLEFAEQGGNLEDISANASAEKSDKTVDNSAESGIMGLRDAEIPAYPVTKDSIQRIPEMRVFETEQLNAAYRQANQDLLAEAAKQSDFVELFIVYDENMQRIPGYDYIVGKERRVRPRYPSVPFHALHNHPSNETFSLTDLNLFVGNANMLSLTATGNKGSVFTIAQNSKDSDRDGYQVYLLEKAEETFFVAGNVEFSVNSMRSDGGRAYRELDDTQQKALLEALTKWCKECAEGGGQFGFKYTETQVADG